MMIEEQVILVNEKDEQILTTPSDGAHVVHQSGSREAQRGRCTGR